MLTLNQTKTNTEFSNQTYYSTVSEETELYSSIFITTPATQTICRDFTELAYLTCIYNSKIQLIQQYKKAVGFNVGLNLTSSKKDLILQYFKRKIPCIKNKGQSLSSHDIKPVIL